MTPDKWDRLRRVFAPVSTAPAQPPLYDPRQDPEVARDMAEERAAILEFDAGFSREEAERRAFGGSYVKWYITHS
ncbi:hypothetical protein B30_13824 [Celeribacter baekdonensis B30]|uniref:Uncharacterized protein n=2 Tax=Celeribacter baekdonensis TaxID=875171 RepID=K2JXI0_9RHOB|nr:hypothetical protein B30_13824 [Celeribacter baekdonensis B30]